MRVATTTATIDLSGLRRHVNPRYWPLLWDEHRFLVLRGGAGSGKSVFAAQKILTRLAREVGARHKFVALRKVLNTQRHSTFALFENLIADWGWAEHFHISRSNLEMTFLPTGGKVIFLGLDDPEKLKSIAGITGFWIEEATEITEEDLEQVNLRLRGLTKTYKQIILSFNPISATHWLKRRFFDVHQKGRTRTVLTTYLDNLYLDEEYKAELEGLKDRDYQLWRIYARGLWGVLKGLIYPPWPVLEVYPKAMESTIYGLDFGYNDPMALLRLDRRDGTYYLTELVYESAMTTADLIARLPSLGVNRSDPIYGDAAEPDRIEEICRAGYNCLPARKGPGSVSAGIAFVKAQRLVTRPGNINLTNETQTYKWAEDKDGRLLDKPVDFNNHLCCVSGTMVETENGPRPIEMLMPGEQVLTLCGMRCIISMRCTGVRPVRSYGFSNGQILTATANHPVFATMGFIPIGDVGLGEAVTVLEGYRCAKLESEARRLSTVASHTGGILTPSVVQSEITSSHKHLRRLERNSAQIFTGKSILTIMAQFLMGLLFTTRTGMREITQSRISNLLNSAPIADTTAKIKRSRRSTINAIILIGSDSKRQNGMVHPLGGNGIRHTQEELDLGLGSCVTMSASLAAKSSLRPSHQAEQGFVRTPANRDGAERQVSTMLKSNAVSVERRSIQTSIAEQPFALSRAQLISIGPVELKPVYNLAVESPHEYFANSILVHNCDALRYALHTHYAENLGSVIGGYDPLPSP